jgi:N utilization substance protein B
VTALQVLYELDGSNHQPVSVLKSRLRETGLSVYAEEYTTKLVDGVLKNRHEIDGLIATYAPAWPISQMAMLDRNVLRVAIFEMLIGNDAPPKAAIDEAVELSKMFGADGSPSFVNGVLGSLIADADTKRES